MNLNLTKIATLALLLGSGSAMAGTMGDALEAVTLAKDGLYLGAGVGAAFNSYQFDVFGTINGIDRFVNSNKTTAQGTVFAGYGGTWNNKFYMGGEVGTNFPNRKTSFVRLNASISGTSTDHLSIEDYVSVDILPGVRINPQFLVYSRIGTAYSNLSFNEDATPPSIPSFSAHLNPLSGRLGAGINYKVNEKFSIATDYIYMSYQALTGNYPGFAAIFNDQSATSYVGVSLVYTHYEGNG